MQLPGATCSGLCPVRSAGGGQRTIEFGSTGTRPQLIRRSLGGWRPDRVRVGPERIQEAPRQPAELGIEGEQLKSIGSAKRCFAHPSATYKEGGAARGDVVEVPRPNPDPYAFLFGGGWRCANQAEDPETALAQTV